MPSNFPTTAPPGRWIRLSAWAAVVHVVFQLLSMTILAARSSAGWSVSTLAQAVVIALLALGGFRRNIPALIILAAVGSWRMALLVVTIIRLNDVSAAETPAALLEYVVAIPAGLLWIAGGISVFRTLRPVAAAE